MNIDLCFVPQTHLLDSKLPAVSGSSGRLIVERTKAPQTVPVYPGHVFSDDSLSYTEAMEAFVRASQPHQPAAETVIEAESDDLSKAQTQKQLLRQQEAQLRDQRRAVRQQRSEEDAACKALRTERNQQKTAKGSPPKPVREAQEKRWKILRQHRKETVEKRKLADQLWREKREQIRQQWSQLPLTVWIAILVITDNCTRQCLGLPVFVAGAKVTSEMIVQALKELLPLELCFLITDRGTHFRAKAFEKLAESSEFIHVLIARRRPQSNGIAERFIRTLKEWLMEKPWGDEDQLRDLLFQFIPFYNDRPHQGLAMPGLSPNEFAKRIERVSAISQPKKDCQLSS